MKTRWDANENRRTRSLKKSNKTMHLIHKLVVSKRKGSAARSVNREFVESCSACNVWVAFLRVSCENRGNHSTLQYLSDSLE